MNTSNLLRWGILGTGAIAHAFAKALAGSKTGRLVAVGSRSRESARKFGDEFGVDQGKRHETYDALLADPDVQAVYISTPHPMHAEWAIKCVRAKKHVLCEKPLGVNFAEASAIIQAARQNGVFLMEAFMFRCHPQIARVIGLIKQKAIGDVRVVQATFSFHWPKPFNPDSRLTSNALAGGGILDVGCYTTSMARLVAGVAAGKDGPLEPTEVKAVGHLEPTGVDGYTVAVLKFPNDVLAQCSTGVQLNQENVVRIFGTDGSIFMPNPWTASRNGGATQLILTRQGKEPETITVECERGLYTIEADTVAEAIARGQTQATFPATSWDDTLGNLRTLDAWRSQIGVTYEFEKPENLKPVPLRRIVRSPRATMKYAKIAHLDKPLSRLCTGADFSGHQPREFNVVADDAFERGINVFDTAHVYG
ncbi:MAG: Gfo/Idh/MocA family oxidoreductase, partial [Tepidisphaeraceae bacterium]